MAIFHNSIKSFKTPSYDTRSPERMPSTSHCSSEFISPFSKGIYQLYQVLFHGFSSSEWFWIQLVKIKYYDLIHPLFQEGSGAE